MSVLTISSLGAPIDGVKAMSPFAQDLRSLEHNSAGFKRDDILISSPRRRVIFVALL